MTQPMLILQPEEFQRWKDHPLTQEFLQFLADWQEAMMVAWAKSSQPMPWEQAQANLLGQLLAINCDEIRSRYDMEPVNEHLGD